MYAEISAALLSAKTALSIAKTAKELSNYNELVAAISEVNMKLMEATTVALASQEKQSELAHRVSELEKQLREIEDWENQIIRYQLYEFPTTKALAYALKPNSDNDEPQHYLCTTCVSKKQKTILQPKAHNLYCPVCDKYISKEPSPPVYINRSGPSRDRR